MRNFIILIQSILKEIFQNKIYILFATIVSCLIGLYTIRKNIIYVSTIKFEFNQTIENRKVGDFYPHSGELWEIYDEASLKVVNAYFRKNEAEKFIQVVKGSDFLSKLYMHEIEIEGVSDYIANFLLKSLRYNQTIISNKIELCNDKELTILNQLHKEVINNKIIDIINIHEGEIFEVNVKSNDRDLSQAIINNFYQVLNQYFKDLKNSKQEKLKDALNLRKQNLSREYQEVYSAYLNSRQRFFNINSLSGEWLNILNLKREEEQLDDQLNEINEITGQINLNIKDNGPQFLLLDDSYMPLEVTNNYIFYRFIFGCFGFFITIFIIVTKKIIRDALQS